jgi:hypothetical protein
MSMNSSALHSRVHLLTVSFLTNRRAGVTWLRPEKLLEVVEPEEAGHLGLDLELEGCTHLELDSEAVKR